MNLVDTFQNRLKYAMDLNNMKQVDLVEKSGLDKTLINKYLAGISKARQSKLSILADILKVNEVWLLGYDVPMTWELEKVANDNISSAVVLVYGTIPAGIPMECIEDIIDTEEIPANMLNGGKEYFGLKIKGTSMSPTYLDGDTIILEKVGDCESGQDAVVMVNGNDGTFKRVFKDIDAKTITLQPLNTNLGSDGKPLFQPVTFNEKQIEELPVRIIGVAREIRRKI